MITARRVALLALVAAVCFALTAKELNDKHGYSIPEWAINSKTGKMNRLGGGLKKNAKNPANLVVKTPQPHTYIKQSDIPANWDWRSMNGTNYVTSSRNQHIPNYCGSCWAMASTSSVADRVRIMRKSAFPDFLIAVQNIVYCVPNGCAGGDPDDVHQYIHNNQIGPDTCQNYVAAGEGHQCEALHLCENCIPSDKGEDCTPVPNYPKFGVAEYGHALGVEQMKAEIYSRGPIACGIDSSPIDAWGYGPERDGIFDKGQNLWAIDHEIAVVGFGEENGTPYWVIRNSWGEYWGDQGYFRLKMGENQLGIEGAACSWAVPTLPSGL